jgi:RNA ligase
MEKRYDRLVEEGGLDALRSLFPHTQISIGSLFDPLEIAEKMDGSLITTVETPGGLWLKSKGSMYSEQAQDAMKLLKLKKFSKLTKWLEEQTLEHGRSVSLEYTAPSNRIVIGYEEPNLTVLGVRDRYDGMFIDLDNFRKGALAKFIVKDIRSEVDDVNEFVASIPDMQGIEGYIIRTRGGQRVKIKTEWYLKLHHIKDSINSQRRLFEAVVYDTVDDIKASFYDDPVALQTIAEMEEKVSTIYNHMVDTVERFYERNKHMERKEYAILGQKELDRIQFALAMAKYSGKVVDYRATMVRHRKDFGIKDDPVDNGEE